MKDILGSLARHAIGGVGAILAYLATVDAQGIADLASDFQAIIGAVMTIGAAAAGIRAKLKARKALRLTAEVNAALPKGAPAVEVKANGEMVGVITTGKPS